MLLDIRNGIQSHVQNCPRRKKLVLLTRRACLPYIQWKHQKERGRAGRTRERRGALEKIGEHGRWTWRGLYKGWINSKQACSQLSQAHSQPSQSSDRDMGQRELEPPPDVKMLELLGGKASDMQMGPVKRKRAGTTSGGVVRLRDGKAT